MPSLKEIRHLPSFRLLCSEAAKCASEYHMLADGDRVLVGVSGGEDSLTLMHVLTALQRRAPFRFELFACTVNMDFAGFDLEALGEYCRRFGWEWQAVTIPGSTLLKEKDAEERPCALCSRLRRGQLHAVADRLGCNKIALGQHLDDLCVSLLMSLFRGGGLKTMGPNVPADSASKRLIRPFATLKKSLIHEFALRMEYPSIRSCPYENKLAETGDRAYLEKLVSHLEEDKFGNLRDAMLRSMRDVRLAHLLDPRYIPEIDPDGGKL